MSDPSAQNENKNPESTVVSPGAPPRPGGNKQQGLPGTPYKPYSETYVPEVPYEPYAEKPESGPPYEPYKGI